MSKPYSDDFDIFDWNRRASVSSSTTDSLITSSSNGLLASVEASAGFTHEVVYADTSVMVSAVAPQVASESLSTATLIYPLDIPNTFTFEFDVNFPAHLPVDFSNNDRRLYAGATVKGEYAAGFIFSEQGIAVSPSPYTDESEIVVLQGTAEDVAYAKSLGTPLTIRATVYSTDARMSVFIDKTSEAFLDNEAKGTRTLRYTIPAMPAALAVTQVLLAGRSLSPTENYDLRMQVSSLRLSSQVLTTSVRPTAVINDVFKAAVGSRLRLDASGSSDPDGLPLTYQWELEEYPDNSEEFLIGGINAFAVHGGVKFEYARSGRDGSQMKIDIRAANYAHPLQLEYISDFSVRITLATSSNGAILTTETELLNALKTPNLGQKPGGVLNTVWGDGVLSPYEGYNPKVSAVLKGSLSGDADGSAVVNTGLVTLSGGVGSNKQKTSLLVDTSGQYRISLTVSNGSVVSLPTLVTVMATHSPQLLQHRPKSDYIWQSLSDFWSLVEDKQVFSTAWSSFTQVISSELLRLMQNDYAKSIRDIQRRVQRRWLNFPIKVDIPDSQKNSLKLFFGGELFVAPDVQHLLPGSLDTSLATTTKVVNVHAHDPSLDLDVAKIADNYAVTVTNSSGQVARTFVSSVEGSQLTLGNSSVNAVEVIDSGLYGEVVKEPNLPNNTFADPQLSSWIINAGEFGSIDGVANNILANITAVALYTEPNSSEQFVKATTNGIPSYDIGPFPGNPAVVGNAKDYYIPLSPRTQFGIKSATSGTVGVLVNGVPLVSPKSTPYLDENDVPTSWHYDGSAQDQGSMDSCNGTPDDQGAYHHHINPVCLLNQLQDSSTEHSPIVGWSLDGFPIYGPYGYDADNNVVLRRSSYTLRGIAKRTHLPDGTPDEGPEINNTYPLGTFVEDYIYEPGFGDLDEYNGVFGPTPEYPEGIYHYHITRDLGGTAMYPYAVGPEYFGVPLTTTESSQGYHKADQTCLFKPRSGALRKGEIRKGDILLVEVDGQVISRRVHALYPIDERTSPVKDALSFEQTVSGATEEFGAQGELNNAKVSLGSNIGRWQIVRPLEAYAKISYLPYFRFSQGVNLRTGNIGRSSVLEVSYQHPELSARSFVRLPVTYAGKRSLHVDWAPLIENFNQSSTLNEDGNLLVMGQGGLADPALSIKPISLYRCNDLAIDNRIVSIPLLGSKTIAPELIENRDYAVYPGLLVFTPVLEGDVNVSAGSNKVYLSTTPEVASKITALAILTGEAGSYHVTDMNQVGNLIEVTLSHTFRFSGTCKFTAQTMTHNSVLPDNLWAELSYLNNDQTIEDNFGLYVGMPKKLLDDVNLDVDYLTLVRACHFALMNGPKMSNIKLAAQAFMGLPYAEVSGFITSIKEDPKTKTKRVTLKPVNSDNPDPSNTSANKGFRTYYFPSEYELGTNPRTGRTIKALSFKEAKKNLLSDEELARYEQLLADIVAGNSPEFGNTIEINPEADDVDQVAVVEVNLKDFYTKKIQDAKDASDSLIPAYTCLVDAVDVFDYVENPDEMSSLLPGEQIVSQYHKFGVMVPAGELGNLNFLPLLKTFLDKAKPSYTSILFFGVHSLGDDITVTDNIEFAPTINLEDSAYTSPFIKKAGAVPLGNIPGSYTGISGELQVPKSYPEKTTLESAQSTANDPTLAGVFTPKILAVGETVGSYTAVGNEILIAHKASNQVLAGNIPPIFTQTSSGDKLYIIDDYPDKNGYLEFLAEPVNLMYPGNELIWFIQMKDANGDPLIYQNLNRGPNGNTVVGLGVPWKYSPDVYDKYESGYVSGVLDDYSGDGSWNENKSVLDFVNEIDSDQDTYKTEVWVPIQFSSSNDNDKEFIVGEEVEILTAVAFTFDSVTYAANSVLEGFGWDESDVQSLPRGTAPVIMHIGSGQHPKIPFGVYNPQKQHPHTYLLLGFEKPDGEGNYGTESGLNAMRRLVEWAANTAADTTPANALTAAGAFLIRGKTSQAVATLESIRGDSATLTWPINTDNAETNVILPNYQISVDSSHPDHAYHKPYFIHDDIFRADKLLDHGPEEHALFTATQYISLGGVSISNFDITHFIKTPPPNIPGNDPHPGLATADKQLQKHPWNPSTDGSIGESNQFVPSFGPGFFKSWSDKTGNDFLVYDWTDEGDLGVAANATTTFTALAGTTKLENLHAGVRALAHKDYHYTHGFTSFSIPEPVILSVNPVSSGYDLRIEGHYFVNVDSTQTTIPTASPPLGGPYGFDGSLGGSWIFFKNRSTGAETAASTVHFETGLNASKFVNGISGDTQKSDGHVLEVNIPYLPATGSYDIILRQYRPYKWASGGTQKYHVDEVTYQEAFYYSVPVSFAGGMWGSGSFGG